MKFATHGDTMPKVAYDGPMTSDWKKREVAINRYLMDELRGEFARRELTDTQVGELSGFGQPKIGLWSHNKSTTSGARFAHIVTAIGGDPAKVFAAGVASAVAHGVLAPPVADGLDNVTQLHRPVSGVDDMVQLRAAQTRNVQGENEAMEQEP